MESTQHHRQRMLRKWHLHIDHLSLSTVQFSTWNMYCIHKWLKYIQSHNNTASFIPTKNLIHNINIIHEEYFNKCINIGKLKISQNSTSNQDGGIGRNASLPCTTRRRITTNNQKCQKIILHGTLTTKELKKTFIQTKEGQRQETGSQAERICGKIKDCIGKAGLAERETEDSKPLAVKTAGVVTVNETPSLTGEFVGKWG